MKNQYPTFSMDAVRGADLTPRHKAGLGWTLYRSNISTYVIQWTIWRPIPSIELTATHWWRENFSCQLIVYISVWSKYKINTWSSNCMQILFLIISRKHQPLRWLHKRYICFFHAYWISKIYSKFYISGERHKFWKRQWENSFQYPSLWKQHDRMQSRNPKQNATTVI